METGKHLLQLCVILLLVSCSSGAEDGKIEQVVRAGDGLQGRGPNWWVTAMFVFGDSVLDAGTNTYFPSLLQADFQPYGTGYFGYATGRFTNGRTYSDFFANFIGLGFPDPYLKRKGPWEVMQGVNYASAGSGLLRSSNAESKVIPFPDQILQFQQTKEVIYETVWSPEAAEEIFNRAIYVINIGANDIFSYIFKPSVLQEDFIASLVKVLNTGVKDLYEAGGRKFIILGSGPLGCVPGALVQAGIINGQCNEGWNKIGQAYNEALEKFVLSLNETFPEIKAIVGKPYSKLKELVVDGEKEGFTAGVKACCGAGIFNAAVQCGRPSDLIKNYPTNLCSDVREHVFWDNYHPTDRAYGLIAKEFWSGNSSYVVPYNLKTLVEWEKGWDVSKP